MGYGPFRAHEATSRRRAPLSSAAIQRFIDSLTAPPFCAVAAVAAAAVAAAALLLLPHLVVPPRFILDCAALLLAVHVLAIVSDAWESPSWR